MRTKAILRLMPAIAGLAVLGAAPAHAVVETFAVYTAEAGANVRFQNSGNSATRIRDARYYTISTPSGSAPGAVMVNFSFIDPKLAPFATNIQALWTLDGVIAKDSAVSATGAFTQGGLSGTFSFLSTSAITISGPGFITTTYAAGSNLLSGSFSAGNILGTIGGTSGASFASGVTGGTITYTSDFLNFGNTVSLDRAQSLTAVAPLFAQGTNGALRTFRGVASGQFSSDPAPLINAVIAVPEPSTWAMLVIGFGLVGVQVRRRKTAVAA